MNYRFFGFFILILLVACATVSAQGFSGDARKIGLGGIGYSENITAKMIDDERQYRSIVIPLGLFQLIADRDRFDPDNDNFDPVLGMEYAANPIHYVFGRDPGGSRGRFVSDIVNGELNRDLNTYHGFDPTNHLLAEGLANPNWGKTIKLQRHSDGSFQGVYLGVGPYLSARTELNIDKDLTDILSSTADVQKPNDIFIITDSTIGQLALDVTAGYRARLALPARKRSGRSGRDGIYIGMNYHYLKGFRYENPDVLIRFDTDADGLVTINPSVPPAVIDYYNSRSGSGFALDFGIGAVVNHWEFGFGANGVANRINWHDLTLKQFTLDSLVSEQGIEQDFVGRRLPVSSTDLRMELPVEYIWNAGYQRRTWSVVTEVSRGFQGTSFHGGVECRLGPIEFRGGARYGLERWHPSGGIGFNLGHRFSIDVAAFGTTTNIERQLRPGIALSLRFNRPPT